MYIYFFIEKLNLNNYYYIYKKYKYNNNYVQILSNYYSLFIHTFSNI